MKRLLILMAKQPLVGQTKTRLVPAVSLQTAADLYHCFLVDKVAAMRQVIEVEQAIAYSPLTGAVFFEQLAPDFHLVPQQGNTLAERLIHVFQWAFEQGYAQVVAIDGDSVTLPPAYLQLAFSALEQAEVDVSIGPCEDGGYYAIGMKHLHSNLLDVEMSTPTVLRDTLKQAEIAMLHVEILPQWYDVDTPTDLDRLRRDLSDHNTYTARFLRGELE